MGKDVIVALDFDGREKTLAFLDRFTEEKPFVKIGMELFYAEGPLLSGRSGRGDTRSFWISSSMTFPTLSKRPWRPCPRWMWTL